MDRDESFSVAQIQEEAYRQILRTTANGGVWMVRKGTELTPYSCEISALRAAVELKADVEFWEYGHAKFVDELTEKTTEQESDYPRINDTDYFCKNHRINEWNDPGLFEYFSNECWSTAGNYRIWSTSPTIPDAALALILEERGRLGPHFGTIDLGDNKVLGYAIKQYKAWP